MKKILKLSNGELKKIFIRPVTYFVFVGIIALLYIFSTFYSPTESSRQLTYSGSSDSIIYNNFISDSSVIQYDGLEYKSVSVEKAKNDIISFINIDDELSNLELLIENCYAKYNKHSESLMENAILVLSQNSSKVTQAKNAFLEFKNNYVVPTYNYLLSTTNKTLNYFISENDYNKLKSFFYDLKQNIPDDYTGYTRDAYISKYEFLTEEYDFTKTVYPILKNIEEIVPNVAELNEILDTYYTSSTAKLSESFDQIYDYFIDGVENKELMLEEIAKYDSIARTTKTFLENKLILSIAQDHTDVYMQDKINYIGFRRYEIENTLSKCQYLLDNDIMEFEVLDTFAFDKASGTTPNAFDFAFYGMRIASILIIIYLFFIIAGSVAEEQNKGTIKLLAIRQITRNKIVAGKYLSAIIYGFLLILFSTVASFIIGVTMYGFPTGSMVLTCFNAGSAFLISPYLLLLISAASSLLNIIFFASFALFIAMLTKSGAVTIFVSSVFYVVTLVLNSTLMNQTWFKFLPLSHIDLFKYFGSTSEGFLSISMAPDASFTFSLIMLLATSIIFNAISHIIFLKRDIA